jgi:hypothetical protein
MADQNATKSVDPLFLTVARISTYDDPEPNIDEKPCYGTVCFVGQ